MQHMRANDNYDEPDQPLQTPPPTSVAQRCAAIEGLEYVQSGANISDLPSRGKFELLAEMGSLQFKMILPPVGGDWWRVYTSLFMKLAPRPSAGAKRSRALRWRLSSKPSRPGV